MQAVTRLEMFFWLSRMPNQSIAPICQTTGSLQTKRSIKRQCQISVPSIIIMCSYAFHYYFIEEISVDVKFITCYCSFPWITLVTISVTCVHVFMAATKLEQQMNDHLIAYFMSNSVHSGLILYMNVWLCFSTQTLANFLKNWTSVRSYGIHNSDSFGKSSRRIAYIVWHHTQRLAVGNQIQQ